MQMALKHTWGLLAHSEQEWQDIKRERSDIGTTYLTYFGILAAIPPVSLYIGTTQVGWGLGWSLIGGEVTKLTAASAGLIAVAYYAAILLAVLVMGKAIHWMAGTFVETRPTFDKCVAFAAYTATPMLLCGLVGLYPVIWLDLLVGFVALGYTVYLLYSGIPVVFDIPKEQGFVLASSILTVGLVTLVGMLATTVILWGIGLGPVYTG
jgi:hypothetical protein